MSSFTPRELDYLAGQRLGRIATVGADGTPHVVPVAFTWDDEGGIARVITSGDSQKARNVLGGGRAALCQIDGRRWLTLEGEASVLVHPEAVRDAEHRYAGRYRVPRENPARVVIALAVDRVTGLTRLPTAPPD